MAVIDFWKFWEIFTASRCYITGDAHWLTFPLVKISQAFACGKGACIALILLTGCSQTSSHSPSQPASAVPVAEQRIAQTPPSPTPTKTTSSEPKTIKIKVTLDSPTDLKVTPLQRVKVGQILSDRPSRHQTLNQQRQFLELRLDRLQQQRRYSLATTRLDIGQAQLETRLARANLAQFYASRRWTNYASKKFPALAGEELTREQWLRSHLFTAQANLKSAYTAVQVAQQKDFLEERQIRNQIASIDRQIASTGVRSPYAGTVKKIKWLGQSDTELIAEVTITVSNRLEEETNADGTEANKTTSIQNPKSKLRQAQLPIQNSLVLSVHDGDTIKVKQEGRTYRIRFACIDAPELSQALGEESRNHLRSLIKSAGSQVQLQIVDTDRYGRRVALVYAGGKLLQVEQVKSGLAYVYAKYLNNCPPAEEVKRAESVAKQQRLGVWSGNSAPPWEFRHRQRSLKSS